MGSQDPIILATGGYDHTIKIWQATGGVCLRTIQHADSQVNDLAITPDKAVIAAAGYQHVRMYDLNSNNANPLVSYDGITKNVTAVGFHDQAKWMYTGGGDGTLRIWDLRVRNTIAQKSYNANSPVNCVCLSPNQIDMYIGAENGYLHIYNLKTDKSEKFLPEESAGIQSISISDDGLIIAIVNDKGNCYIYSIDSNSEGTKLKEIISFAAHRKYILRCAISPCSKMLATTSADNKVKIWLISNLNLIACLTNEKQRWVWDCAFSKDSQYIVTASSDNAARLWHVETGKIIREYNGHLKSIISLAFNDTS